MQENFLIRKYPTLCAAAFYFLVALVFTFPLVLKMGSQLPQGGGDVYQSIASISAGIKQAQSLPLKSEVIYLAKGLNTYTWYVLLGLFMDKIAAYNVIFLLSFILSGLGMYMLSVYLTKNKMASVLAGLIFAFSPFHYYQSVAVHLGSMHQEWIPFLALYLLRFFEKFKFKYFVLCGIFALLIAMAEHQMLAFTILFIAFFVAYKLWFDRSIIRNKKFWAYAGSSFLLLAIVAFGMFGQLLKVATSDDNFLDPGMNAANKYSMGALDPIAPPSFHAIWPGFGSFMQDILMSTTKGRGSYFIGFSVLAVLVYFVILLYKSRKNDTSGQKRMIYFWGLTVGVFYIFSLGPAFSIGKLTIYLPYFLVYKFLPFYENIRTTGRMFVIALLGISVLFAYGYVEVLKRYQNRKLLMTSIFAAVILLEFWVAPVATMAVTYSPFYDQIAKDSQPYKLIEIPGSTSYEFASYEMLTNDIAKKAVLNGMPLARKIQGEFDMQQSTPVIKQLLYTIPKGNDPDTKDNSDIVAPFDYSQSNAVLNYYDVGYITVSKLYVNKDVLNLAEKFIESHIAYSKKYEDDYLVAYQVKQVAPSGFYYQLNDSSDNHYSSSFVAADGVTYREMGDGSGIRVINMGTADQKITVTVDAKATSVIIFSSPSDLQAASDQATLGAVSKQYSFVTMVKPGKSVIPFSILDANKKAIVISNSKKNPAGALVSQISVQAAQ